MSTVATPKLLTLDEVAERLSVHRATAYRMVRDGRLPAVQLGRRGNALRVDERELDAWLFAELPAPCGVDPAGAPGTVPETAVELQAPAGTRR